MKVKKIICGLASLALSVGMMLTGCSPNGNNSKTPDGDGAKNRPEVTLTYYYGNPPQADEKLVEDEMNKILKEKINAKIDLMPIIGDEYEKKLNLMISTQEEFDLCFTSSWQLNYAANAAAGAFADITELLPSKAPKLWASMKTEWWDAAKVNGKIYGVMNQQIFARQSGFWFDNKYLQKYNVDASEITTFRKFADYMIMLKDKEPADNTKFMTWKFDYMGQLQQMLGWENVSGSNIPGSIMSDGSKTTVFNEYDTPEYLEMIKIARELQSKGVIAKDVLTIATEPREQLKGACANIAPGNAENEARNNKMEKVVMVPIGDAHLTTNNVTATMTGVSVTSKNKERAVEFLELLNSDKALYNLMCHGIPGKHYTTVGENKWTSIANSAYEPNADWMFGCVYNSRISQDSADDLWEQTKEKNNTAKVSALMGFVYDNTKVKTEEANCQAVIDKYKDTFAAGLYTDVDSEYTKFLKELKDAGVEKVMAEKQTQVNAFLGK